VTYNQITLAVSVLETLAALFAWAQSCCDISSDASLPEHLAEAGAHGAIHQTGAHGCQCISHLMMDFTL